MAEIVQRDGGEIRKLVNDLYLCAGELYRIRGVFQNAARLYDQRMPGMAGQWYDEGCAGLGAARETLQRLIGKAGDNGASNREQQPAGQAIANRGSDSQPADTRQPAKAGEGAERQGRAGFTSGS